MKVHSKIVSILLLTMISVTFSSISSAADKKTTSTKKTFSQSPWKVKPKPSSTFLSAKKKSKSDLDFDPNSIKKVETGNINVFGETFKLPEIASASQIVNLLQKEIRCEVSNDLAKLSIFPTYGSEASDTSVLCFGGDPNGEGYIFYVTTSKDALAIYNSKKSPEFRTQFANSYVYSSLRAVVMVVGGSDAFEAEEISYDILSVLGYQPDRVKLGS